MSVVAAMGASGCGSSAPVARDATSSTLTSAVATAPTSTPASDLPPTPSSSSAPAPPAASAGSGGAGELDDAVAAIKAGRLLSDTAILAAATASIGSAYIGSAAALTGTFTPAPAGAQNPVSSCNYDLSGTDLDLGTGGHLLRVSFDLDDPSGSTLTSVVPSVAIPAAQRPAGATFGQENYLEAEFAFGSATLAIGAADLTTSQGQDVSYRFLQALLPTFTAAINACSSGTC